MAGLSTGHFLCPYNFFMLSAEARSHLAIVLVGARNPQNIGAAARAMQDFGFSDLRVVNTFSAPFEAAQLDAGSSNPEQPVPKSAVGAGHVMRSARRFDRLADAIADCTLTVGTTAIGGREIEREILTLQQVAPLMLTHLRDDVIEQAQTPRVALLFGSEKTGLTNDQLSHCSLLTTIPMFQPGPAAAGETPRHLSMNLGQSVAVCLYELVREGFEGARDMPVAHHASVTGSNRERLTQLVLQAMDATGYARRFPANARVHVVRRLAHNLATGHDEAVTWMGFFRQILRREPDQDEA